MPADFAARKRAAARQDITDTALRLFLAKGYDAVTVEQIAAAVGLTARSVFRYFPAKEDIVLAQLTHTGEQLQAALDARPPTESPWVALRAAFDALLDSYDDEVLRKTTQMVLASPALRACHLERQAQWQELLTPAIAERLGVPTHGSAAVPARALVAAALACLDTAYTTWAQTPGSALRDLLDAALAAVHKR